MKPVPSLGVALLAVGISLAPSSAVATTDPSGLEAIAVSGTVTAAGTDEPIVDVCVAVRTAEQSWWDQKACTDEAGAYTFALPPGRYEVQFDPTDDAYGTQWWDGAHSPVDAEDLVLRRGEPQTGIDASLVAGATMTGQAIDGATGAALDDACIEVSAAGVEDSIAWINDAPRRWEIRGLPPGEVTARVLRCDRLNRFTWAYDALQIEDATAFQLRSGRTTPVGELALAAGGTVTGMVTAHRSGEPLGGIVVTMGAYGRSGELGDAGSTRPDGSYEVRDIQPGTQYPVAYSYTFPYRYAPQWAGGATDRSEAEPLELEPGGTAVIDFDLDRSATITGTLEDIDAYIPLDAYSRSYPEGGELARLGFSSDVNPETDTFTVWGLPATRVMLGFNLYGDDPAGQGAFFYDGVRDAADATLVRLRPGRTVHLTAHLPPPE